MHVMRRETLWSAKESRHSKIKRSRDYFGLFEDKEEVINLVAKEEEAEQQLMIMNLQISLYIAKHYPLCNLNNDCTIY